MDEKILCDSPRVRVSTARARLVPCERLPLYYFSSDRSGPARAPEPRLAHATAGPDRRGGGLPGDGA